jgi:hypothetical protein
MRTHLVALMGDMPEAKPPRVASDDRTTAAGSVRHIVLKTERDLPVPIAIHHPQSRRAGMPLIIYVSFDEKRPGTDLPPQAAIERLTEKGFIVAVPQVRGTGSTSTKDMNSVMLYSMALGKHLFSSRVWDLARVIDFLTNAPEYTSSPLVVWGEGIREGPTALYLAAIDNRVSTAISSHGLVTYQNVVDADGLPDFDYYVPAILRYADLPQIAAAAAPRRVWISAPVDIEQRILDIDRAAKEYEWTAKAFAAGRSGGFAIVAQTDLVRRLAVN